MNPGDSKISIKTPLIIFFCLTLSIAGIGLYAFILQRNHMYTVEKETLEGVAKLKVQQIVSWRKERLTDGAVIANDVPLIDELAAWQKDRNNNVLKSKIESYLRNGFGIIYSHYFVCDENYSILFSDSPNNPIDLAIINKMKSANTIKTSVLTDIYFNKNTGMVQLDLIVPLFSGSRNLGFVILLLDPQKNIFPIIQSWPTPSRSAETLLAENIENHVVYLNELRHVKNTPMKLIVSMSDTNILAVKGLTGQIGILEGRDYRNIPVIGATDSVPDTRWIVVAKMDKSEITGPIIERAFIVFIPVLILIFFAGLIAYYQSKILQKAQHARLLEIEIAKQKSEIELAESENRYRALFQNMLNGMAYCKMLYSGNYPEDLIYLEVNTAFETLTGLKNVKGKKITEVIPGIREADEELFEIYSRVALTGNPEVIEIYVQAMKMWFSISIYSPQREYFVAVFDVVTERKLAEKALKESNAELKNTELQLKENLLFLERSNKELEQFAYVASHDLQEPLRMVSSYTQLLAKKYKDVLDANAVEYINFAVDGAQRMQQLINDLLDYSRLTRQDKTLEPVSTSHVLGLAIVNLRKKIEETNTLITNEHLPSVHANEQQLVRVLF